MARGRRRPARPGALAESSPFRILSQIFLLQFCYYGVAIVLTVFVTLTAGQHPNAGLLFDWTNVRGDVTSGWTAAMCWVLTAAFMAIPMVLVVARSKLVLDFALTILFLHLVTTSLFSRSLPFSFSWWIVQIVSAGIMIGLGTWACQWRELQPMAFGGHSKDTNGHAIQPAHDEEAGYEMGNKRGRGEDGAGQYEMVTLPPRPEPS